MPDNLAQKPGSQNNTSNINKTVKKSKFARHAEAERAQFQAQKLNRIKNQRRNQQKNNLTNLSRLTIDDSTNEDIAQSDFAENTETERAQFQAESSQALQSYGVNNSQNALRNRIKNTKLALATKQATDNVIAKLGIKESSRGILNILWGAVFEDATLLSLLGLNVYMFTSLLIPSLAQLGEDSVIGTWLGGGMIAQLAEKTGIAKAQVENLKIFPKIIEILIILTIDIFILAILAFVFYLIYKIYSSGLWDKIGVMIDTAQGDVGGVIEKIFEP